MEPSMSNNDKHQQDPTIPGKQHSNRESTRRTKTSIPQKEENTRAIKSAGSKKV